MDENDKKAIDELNQGVVTLTQAVADMKEGLVDKQTVETIVSELFEKQAEANPALKRRGLGAPDADEVEEQTLLTVEGTQRMHLIQSMPARKVAPLIKRDVADVQAFQQAVDNLMIISEVLGVEPQSTKYYETEFKPLVQAMNRTNANEGADYVPRELSASLIDRVELKLQVANLFNSIDMPTDPFDLPGRPVARQKTAGVAENTADTAGNAVKRIQIASRKVTLAAKKFWGLALVTKEAEEDAIIAMLPFIQSELERYLGYDVEDATVNGDTAGAIDTGWAADDPRKNFNGLRKALIAAAKNDAGAVKLAVSHLRANRKNMGIYGVDPAELAHIVSMAGYIELLDDTAVFTLEKYGPQATILTGELAKVDNVPIIVSEAVRSDLTAAGVYDGVTVNKTQALTVYRPGFGRGERRSLTIEILRELYSEWDQDGVKISTRKAFVPLYPTATEKVVAVTNNVTN